MRISSYLTRGKSYPKVKSDPQQHRIYGMERNDLVGLSISTLSPIEHLRAVASHACRKYQVPQVNVSIYNNPKEKIYGQSFPDSRIVLNKGHNGANMMTLLHELAHHLDWHIDGFDEEDHGPTFMRYYIDLMDRYKMLPAYAFEAICDKHGIKYLPSPLTI